MSDKAYTIQVKPSAELAAIVDEVLRVPSPRVFLVVPDEARIVGHVLNFKLLRREADAGRKELIIVSSHPRVQGLATKAGLKVHQLTREFLPAEGERDIEPVVRQKKKVSDIMASPSSRTHRRIEVREEDAGGDEKESEPVSEKAKEALIRSILNPSPEKGGKKKKSSSSLKPKVSSYWKGKHNMSIPRPRMHIPAPRKTLLFSTIGISAIVLGAVFYVILPSVEVTITPRTFTIEETISITISADIADPDLGNRVLPGQIIEDSDTHSQRFGTTGREDIEDRAVGTIRVYNEFSSAPQTLVATTRFVSQDGFLFRTTKTTVIPGAKIEGGKIVASSTLVDVIADEAGNEYNIGPSAFSIPGFSGTPKFTAFYGKSEEAMQGGFRGVANVASQNDIVEAEQILLGTVASRAADKLRANIPSGYFLAPGALQEDSPVVEIGAKAGERGDDFEASVYVAARAVLFRMQDIDAALDYYFDNIYRLQEGSILLPQREITYEFEGRDYESGEFTIALVVRQEAAEEVDADVIRDALVGRQEGEARSFLSQYPGIDTAHIRFWPFWVNEVPRNSEKVTVHVEYRT